MHHLVRVLNGIVHRAELRFGVALPAPVAAAADIPPRPAPAAAARLASLDAFRGLAVAGMILVNNPGTWSAIY